MTLHSWVENDLVRTGSTWIDYRWPSEGRLWSWYEMILGRFDFGFRLFFGRKGWSSEAKERTF